MKKRLIIVLLIAAGVVFIPYPIGKYLISLLDEKSVVYEKIDEVRYFLAGIIACVLIYAIAYVVVSYIRDGD